MRCCASARSGTTWRRGDPTTRTRVAQAHANARRSVRADVTPVPVQRIHGTHCGRVPCWADAFWTFGEAEDKTTALEMFSELGSRFPESSLIEDLPPHVKRLKAAKPTPAPALAAAAPVTTAPAAAAPVATMPVSSRAATSDRVTNALKTVKREVLPDALRITLELGQEVTFRSNRLDAPPRVFIDFENTRPVEAIKDATIPFPDDVVRKVRIGRQTESRTRVVMDLAGAGRYSVYTLSRPVPGRDRLHATPDCAFRPDRCDHRTTVPVVLRRQRSPTSPRRCLQRHRNRRRQRTPIRRYSVSQSTIRTRCRWRQRPQRRHRLPAVCQSRRQLLALAATWTSRLASHDRSRPWRARSGSEDKGADRSRPGSRCRAAAGKRL